MAVSSDLGSGKMGSFLDDSDPVIHEKSMKHGGIFISLFVYGRLYVLIFLHISQGILNVELAVLERWRND